MTVGRLDERLTAVVRYCSQYGVSPLPWQNHDLPTEDAAYPASWEDAWIRHTPRDRIHRWVDELPIDKKYLGSSRPLDTSETNPAPYPDEHSVEYPPEMDLAIDDDLDPGDSFSAMDLGVRRVILAPEGERERLPTDQVRRPARWVSNDDMRQKASIVADSKAILRSHMI
jgi:hypothetical protein